MKNRKLILPVPSNGSTVLSSTWQPAVGQVRQMQRLQVLGSFAARGLFEINQLLAERERLVLEVLEQKLTDLPETKQEEAHRLYKDYADQMASLEDRAGKQIIHQVKTANRR